MAYNKSKIRVRSLLHEDKQLLPSALFTPEQLNPVLKVIQAYKTYYEDYYKFKRGIIAEHGYVIQLWSTVVYNEIFKSIGLYVMDWRIFLLVWGLNKSETHQKKGITMQYIRMAFDELHPKGTASVYNRLKKLRKLGLLTNKIVKTHKAQWFLTTYGHHLITRYSIRYSQLFNDFFQPGI